MASLHFRVRTRIVVPLRFFSKGTKIDEETEQHEKRFNASRLYWFWLVYMLSFSYCFLVSISYCEPIFLVMSRVGALIQSTLDSRTKCRSVYPCAKRCVHFISLWKLWLTQEAFYLQAKWQHGDVILNEFTAKSWNWIASLQKLVRKCSSRVNILSVSPELWFSRFLLTGAPESQVYLVRERDFRRRAVSASMTVEYLVIFGHCTNLWGHMALGSTQPLTEMSTRNLPVG
jgi:hypothetical protein